MIMTALVSIILGTGLPASAAYLVVAIVLAPLLINLGIPLLPAHLFAFYFANFSYVTPPVAIAALFGAQIAGAAYMKTGIESAKVGVAGFVLPFMIVWCPSFLGDFSNPVVSVLSLLACILVFIGLQAGLVGYLMTRLRVIERILMITGGLILMTYLYGKNVVWFVVGVGLLGACFFHESIRKRRLKVPLHHQGQ